MTIRNSGWTTTLLAALVAIAFGICSHFAIEWSLDETRVRSADDETLISEFLGGHDIFSDLANRLRAAENDAGPLYSAAADAGVPFAGMDVLVGELSRNAAIALEAKCAGSRIADAPRSQFWQWRCLGLAPAGTEHPGSRDATGRSGPLLDLEIRPGAVTWVVHDPLPTGRDAEKPAAGRGAKSKSAESGLRAGSAVPPSGQAGKDAAAARSSTGALAAAASTGSLAMSGRTGSDMMLVMDGFLAVMIVIALSLFVWAWHGREARMRTMRENLRLQRELLAEREERVRLFEYTKKGLAHDMLNLLNRIALRVGLIADDAVRRPIAERIDEMKGMVDEVGSIDYRGLIQEQFGLHDIVAFARRVFEDLALSRQGADGRVSFEVRTASGVATGLEEPVGVLLLCRPVGVQRAIRDLVTNAETHGKGLTALRVLDEDDRVIVEVSDRGGGIPEDMRERMFGPFERMDPAHPPVRPSAEGAGGGWGLGLWIARSVARSHRGDVEIQDSGAGAGLTVRLVLSKNPVDGPTADSAPDASRAT